MTRVDQLVLDVLRSRAAWQKGKAHIPMNEVAELLALRHPGEPRPTSGDIVQAVQRLRNRRALTWAAINTGQIYFIV